MHIPKFLISLHQRIRNIRASRHRWKIAGLALPSLPIIKHKPGNKTISKVL